MDFCRGPWIFAESYVCELRVFDKGFFFFFWHLQVNCTLFEIIFIVQILIIELIAYCKELTYMKYKEKDLITHDHRIQR